MLGIIEMPSTVFRQPNKTLSTTQPMKFPSRPTPISIGSNTQINLAFAQRPLLLGQMHNRFVRKPENGCARLMNGNSPALVLKDGIIHMATATFQLPAISNNQKTVLREHFSAVYLHPEPKTWLEAFGNGPHPRWMRRPSRPAWKTFLMKFAAVLGLSIGKKGSVAQRMVIHLPPATTPIPTLAFAVVGVPN